MSARHQEAVNRETSLLGDILRHVQKTAPDLWTAITDVSEKPDVERMVATAMVLTDFAIGQRFMREGLRMSWFFESQKKTLGVSEWKINEAVFALQNASAEWVTEFVKHIDAIGAEAIAIKIRIQNEKVSKELSDQFNREFAGLLELEEQHAAVAKAEW